MFDIRIQIRPIFMIILLFLHVSSSNKDFVFNFCQFTIKKCVIFSQDLDWSPKINQIGNFTNGRTKYSKRCQGQKFLQTSHFNCKPSTSRRKFKHSKRGWNMHIFFHKQTHLWPMCFSSDWKENKHLGKS